MTTNRKEVDHLAEIDQLPEDQKADIAALAAQFHRQVKALRRIQAATGEGRDEIAQAIGVGPSELAAIEEQADAYLGAVRDLIEDMGGEISISVRIPGQELVEVDCLADLICNRIGAV